MSRLTLAIAPLLPIMSLAGQASTARDGLVVPPGAEEIARTTSKGGAVLTYDVREPFPARRTLSFLQTSLARAGWTPAVGTALRSYERSSHEAGWHEIRVESTGGLVQIWSGRWTDAAGNEVTYSLVYSSPLTQHGLRPTYVGVGAWYYTAAEAARLHADHVLKEELERLRLQPPRPRPTPCPE